MRRYPTILAVLLLSVSFSLAGGGYYRVVGVASDDTLSVRSAPSASAKKLTELMPYDTGIVIDSCTKRGRTTWCSIDFLSDDYMFFERGFSAILGKKWVNRRYLKASRDILYSDAFSYATNHNIFRVRGVAPDDQLNVRSAPYTHAKKVGVLYPDDVGIIARKCQKVGRSRWCYVAYDSQMRWSMGVGSMQIPYAILGWVNMRYLTPDTTHTKSRLSGMTFAGEVY